MRSAYRGHQFFTIFCFFALSLLSFPNLQRLGQLRWIFAESESAEQGWLSATSTLSRDAEAWLRRFGSLDGEDVERTSSYTI